MHVYCCPYQVGFLLCAFLYLITPSISTEWHTRCTNNCTQTVGSAMWPCEIIEQSVDSETKSLTDHKCDSPYPPVKNKNLPPALNENDVNVSLIYDVYGHYTGQFPGIKVSVSVPLIKDTETLQGIQIILRGETGDDTKYYYTYKGKKICRILDVSMTDMVRRYQDPEKVTFHYDCLKPLSPDSEYELEIKLLPTNDLGYSPTVKKTMRIPKCDSNLEAKDEFHECLVHRDEYKAADWSPTIFQVEMLGSDVKVGFNLPDKKYMLDEFRLLLYKDPDTYVGHTDVTPKEEGTTVIVATSGVSYSMFYTKPFTIAEEGDYVVKLQPRPTGKDVCKSLYDKTVDCRVTTSPTFPVDSKDLSVASTITEAPKNGRNPRKRRRKIGDKTRRRNRGDRKKPRKDRNRNRNGKKQN
ncbi:uncharacterized protein LOC144440413 [Glandiceps talaboti]